MSEKTMSVKTAKIKAKIKEAKDSVVDGVKAVGYWCAENPFLTMAIVGSLASFSSKTMKLHNENVRRRRTFYDPRKGRYSEARRDLSAREIDELYARYDEGESYHHILYDMGLLK